MRNTRCRAAAFLLTFATAVVAGGAIAAEERVELVFAWPDDLRGSIEFTFSLSKEVDSLWTEVGAGRGEFVGHGRSAFSVSPTGGDLLVAFHDTAIEFESNAVPGLEGQIQDLGILIDHEPLNYRVTRRGEFLGLDDPAKFRDSILDRYLDEGSTEASQQLRRALEPVLSDERLGSNYQANWNRDIGSWVGAVLRTGTPLVAEEMQSSGMPGDAPLPVRVSYSLIGRAPCQAGDSAGCVELETRSVLDVAEALAAAHAFLRHRDPSGRDNIEVTRIHTVITTRLICDPDTLVPYRSTIEWVSTMGLLADGQPLIIRNTKRQSVTFDYD